MEFNASLLSLFTISEETEMIFFAFCKEVQDFAPEKPYWYPGKGANAKADFLWKEKKVKQWMLIGKDVEVQRVFEELLSTQSYAYRIGDKIIQFSLPHTVKKNTEDDFVKIKDICVCGRNEYPDEYESKSSLYDIGFLIAEENNCEYIEGFKSHPQIKPMYPAGLIGHKALKKYLEENICAVFEKREIYWSLRGDRKRLINGEPSRYTGFIQASSLFRDKHQVCIRDIEGVKILGQAEINTQIGTWELELSEPAYKGQLLIQEKDSGKFTCGEKFYLIKDIQINPEIIHTVVTDLYGRTISISKKQFKEPKIKTSIWHSENAPDTRQSEIELSDKFTDILLSLGEKIIFNDPYFWGDIVVENNQIKASISQKVFLNALITAIAKADIKEIMIIGYWSRAKNHIASVKEDLINNYKVIYTVLKENFTQSSLFSIKKFELILSQEPFHDRYWMGDNDTIYNVSNSINGAFESKELKITQEERLSVMKIAPRILRRYEKGEKCNLMN